MSLDNVLGTRLYIGGALSLRRRDALKKANITHVVTALRPPLEYDLYQGYRHHVIQVDDIESEDIIQWFKGCNDFIREGLDGGGGVLVHCAMGKSRSATLILAYLLFIHFHPAPLSPPDLPGSPTPTPQPLVSPLYPTSSTPSHLLKHLRRTRPQAEPNASFMAQLEMYARLGCPDDIDGEPEYQRWCWERRGLDARATNLAPSLEGLRLANAQDRSSVTSANGGARGGESGEGTGRMEGNKAERRVYKCKRCRQPLATSDFVLPPHTPNTARPTQPTSEGSQCTHLFLSQPLSWMRPEIEEGKLEGRLECPKRSCKAQVGRYAWQGTMCSCGEWVTPGISLGRGKVDEVVERGQKVTVAAVEGGRPAKCAERTERESRHGG